MSMSRFKAVSQAARNMQQGIANDIKHEKDEITANNNSDRRMQQAQHRRGLLDESWRSRQEYEHPDQQDRDRRADWLAYQQFLDSSNQHYGQMIFDYERDIRGSSAFGVATPDEQASLLQRPTEMARALQSLISEYQGGDYFQRWRSSQWSPDFSSILSPTQNVPLDSAINERQDDGGGDGNENDTQNENNVSDEQIASIFGSDAVRPNRPQAVLGDDGQVRDPRVPPQEGVGAEQPTESAGARSDAQRQMLESLQTINRYVRTNGRMPRGGMEGIANIARSLGRPVPVPQGLSEQERVMVEAAIERALNL